MPIITYTKVDEAPALATHSLLPILQAFVKDTGIEIETADISLASRIAANFPEKLQDAQKIPDDLDRLGKLAKTPAANIIKLPNISASIPQLQAALKELQSKGYDLPDYPENSSTEEAAQLRARFAKVLGSAVNPILREGNSDRRAAVSVKEYSMKHPPRLAQWDVDSRAHVAHMTASDFYGTELSCTVPEDTQADIEFVSSDGTVKTLKKGIRLRKGEVIDSSTMNASALRSFYSEQIEDARERNLLLSLHLKATMMKVSDPVIFGHAVSVFYEPVLTKHAELLKQVGFDPNNGIADLYSKISSLPSGQRKEVESDIEELYEQRPKLAMVDSDKGITNLHVPNKIIIDASIPVVIRDGGKMWGPDGKLHDTKALIPDRCYATMYQAVFEDCQKHGAFDPSTMGSVSNVGLMAHKAEEYGSHDKTFIAEGKGVIRITDSSGTALLEHQLDKDDIFRMCQTQDAAVKDWVKLAVNRARATGDTSVFWLDQNRAHDAQLIKKVEAYLKEHDTEGLDIQILEPVEAMQLSLKRIRKRLNTISVTGNILRDYLTDLFPILELGTSSKMLSIVPLMQGGGLFETGAGGSAPKHVQQFLAENHLRWDSLGEFLALGVSFEHIATTGISDAASLLAETLETAVSLLLEEERSPSRKVHELDNRGSHYYFALYWAEALAAQDKNPAVKKSFIDPAKKLRAHEARIVDELNAVQGHPVDIGGYYMPDPELLSKAMRPSQTLNQIIDAM